MTVPWFIAGWFIGHTDMTVGLFIGVIGFVVMGYYLGRAGEREAQRQRFMKELGERYYDLPASLRSGLSPPADR